MTKNNRELLIFLLIPFLLSTLLYYYKFEKSEARFLKSEIIRAIESGEDKLIAKNVFKFNWDVICSIRPETVFPEEPLYLSDYIESDYKSLIPDTFDFNFGYGLLFLQKQKPVFYLKIKDSMILFNSKKYYLSTRGDGNCASKDKAVFLIREGNSKNYDFNVVLEENRE